MTFATLALICLVAMLGPLASLARRLHLPIVIGELIVGIALGGTGLHLLDAANPTFGFLAQMGFALVMFVAGSHVPIRQRAMVTGLLRGGLRALGIAGVAVPVGWGIAAVFHTGHGLLYAVLLASSSASLVMPALGDEPVTSQPGLELLAQLAVADAGCIVALPLAMQPARAGHAALGALAVLAAAAVCAGVLDWLVRTGRERRLHRLSESRHLALELRITLTMLFALVALADVVHVSVMLAGFAAGLAWAAAGEPRRVANQTFALTDGLFGPIFFVWLGASLDLRSLAQHPRAVLLGLVLGLAAVGVHALATITGQPWPMAVASSAQLGVPVGAAALGTGLRVLQPGEGTALLLGALVTIAAVALVSGRLLRAVRPEQPDQLLSGGS